MDKEQGQEINTPAGKWRPLLLIGFIALVLVLAKAFNAGEKLGALRNWLESLGPWGALAFVLLYITAVVAALPGSALTIAAGALFGSVMGVVLVSVSATAGAGLAFLIARYFAREATVQWLSDKESFRKLDRLSEEYGAIIVALTRLVPIFPFNLLNYGFGLTKIPFGTYLFWSWLCMIPGTVLYVVGADTLMVGLSGETPPWELVAVLLSALVVLSVLGYFARRKLQQISRKTNRAITWRQPGN